MNLTFEGFGRDERIDEERSQWFTPMDIARKMVAWCGDLPRGTTILEPSAGSGNIVAAIRERSTMQHVHAVELDPYYADRLAARFPDDKRLTVRAGSYLDEPAPAERYRYGIANPPYESGLDGEFLAKMTGECDRIVALVRLACLAGKDRHAKVWRQLEGEWRMVGLALFPSRPEFEAGRAVGTRREGESAKADFCVVKLSRTPGDKRTEIEWWT